MKIITLNLWGGRIYKPLIDFISKNQNIDVFCFQEMYHNAIEKNQNKSNGEQLDFYNEMKFLLPDHIGYFCSTVGDYYGIATFVQKSLKVQASGDINIYKNSEYNGRGANHSRKAFWVDINLNNKNLSVLNVHGLWNGKGKTDTPDRIEQSRCIRKFMDSVKGYQVICGDFNLLPDTESISILERGMQNLIKEYKVNTTRTSLYTRAETSGSFADYIFASPDIQIIDFKVLPDEVSDHAPLLLEIKKF